MHETPAQSSVHFFMVQLLRDGLVFQPIGVSFHLNEASTRITGSLHQHLAHHIWSSVFPWYEQNQIKDETFNLPVVHM